MALRLDDGKLPEAWSLWYDHKAASAAVDVSALLYFYHNFLN
jgi:hypothetical protein